MGIGFNSAIKYILEMIQQQQQHDYEEYLSFSSSDLVLLRDNFTFMLKFRRCGWKLGPASKVRALKAKGKSDMVGRGCFGFICDIDR